VRSIELLLIQQERLLLILILTNHHHINKERNSLQSDKSLNNKMNISLRIKDSKRKINIKITIRIITKVMIKVDKGIMIRMINIKKVIKIENMKVKNHY
jgi:hypothetical protein